jgi:hypothetical protein
MAGEVLPSGCLWLREVSGEVQGVVLVTVVGLISHGLVTGVVVVGWSPCRRGQATGRERGGG